MLRFLSFSMIIQVASLTCLANASFAQATPDSLACPDNKTFALQAVINERKKLRRDEVGAEAIGLAPTQEKKFLAAPAPPPLAPGQIAEVAKQNFKSQAAAEDKGSLAEYNVDWSSWMSVMADRWFYLLRTTEYAAGIQFHSPRPALIQFTCYADGSIGNILLKQSSGVQAYDRMQIQSLTQIAPLPPFPKGTRHTSVTLVQGWESHPKQAGEEDFQPGSFGKGFPQEKVSKWIAGK